MEKETATALLGPILAPATSFASALRERLRGLWEGELPADTLLLTEAAADEQAPSYEGPLDRLMLAQWLWGEGHVLPGGESHALDLVAPVGLAANAALLDVSAGLGGASRGIARAYDLYVTGLERDFETARRGMEASLVAGLQKRAPITRFDPGDFELKPGAFDCVMARETTYALDEKERFLRSLVLGLKPQGQLVLTDFVLDPPASGGEVAAWAAGCALPPSLWTFAQYADCLGALACTVEIFEDMTPAYRGFVLSGWERLMAEVDLKRLPSHHRQAILEDAEHWVRLIAALDSGGLRFYRFMAVAGK